MVIAGARTISGDMGCIMKRCWKYRWFFVLLLNTIINRRPVLARPVKIGFYLDNPLFIHLCDQLFFEPALRLTKNNFDTCIRPTPEMLEYFINSGAKVINDGEIFNCDIIVTREELLPDVLPRTKANIIAINTLANDMCYRISESITYSLANIFKIEIPENFDFAPRKPSVSQKRVASEKVILAPFVNSGWFRVWESDVKRLSLQAKNFAEECSHSLCLVGGEADAESKIPTVIGADLDLQKRQWLFQPVHQRLTGSQKFP
jgi:hypothetical protein